MGTPRKLNAILLNIKINRPKLVNMCRYKLATYCLVCLFVSLSVCLFACLSVSLSVFFCLYELHAWCKYIHTLTKFHGNILNLSENIAKSFRGATFLTHTVHCVQLFESSICIALMSSHTHWKHCRVNTKIQLPCYCYGRPCVYPWQVIIFYSCSYTFIFFRTLPSEITETNSTKLCHMFRTPKISRSPKMYGPKTAYFRDGFTTTSPSRLKRHYLRKEWVADKRGQIFKATTYIALMSKISISYSNR